MTFDPRQGLVRIVISLLYQPQLLPLALVQARLHTVHQEQSEKFKNIHPFKMSAKEERQTEEDTYDLVDVYLYASLSLSKARMSSLVSCLYDRGGKGIGENLRLSSQCTVVV